MGEEEKRKDLLKYYKKVKVCSNPKCKRLFGVDGPECNNFCPICLSSFVYGESRLERMERFEEKEESKSASRGGVADRVLQ